MKDLQKHEEFEMLVLEQMRKTKILDQLIFGGGTMLRLCFDLPRYSVDFDFYLKKGVTEFKPWIKKLSASFEEMGAQITDCWEKHFTFLWELRVAGYPRRLKIEVRKKSSSNQKTELAIAHSLYSPVQVRLTVFTLEQMWQNKVNALMNRKEIRDAYDLEFLSMRRASDFILLKLDELKKIKITLDSFANQDFKTTLNAILEKEEANRILSSRFSYLQSLITAAIEKKEGWGTRG